MPLLNSHTSISPSEQRARLGPVLGKILRINEGFESVRFPTVKYGAACGSILDSSTTKECILWRRGLLSPFHEWTHWSVDRSKASEAIFFALFKEWPLGEDPWVFECIFSSGQIVNTLCPSPAPLWRRPIIPRTKVWGKSRLCHGYKIWKKDFVTDTQCEIGHFTVRTWAYLCGQRIFCLFAFLGWSIIRFHLHN